MVGSEEFPVGRRERLDRWVQPELPCERMALARVRGTALEPDASAAA